MPLRLSSQFQPSNLRLRKRIGLALQLTGAGCFALDLCLPQGPGVEGLVFTLWVFLGYQMQTAAQDRERLEALVAGRQVDGDVSVTPTPVRHSAGQSQGESVGA